MWLPKLQNKDKKAKTLRFTGLLKNWEDVKRVFEYQDLPYVPGIICSKVISRHYDDLLAEHFGIDKT